MLILTFCAGLLLGAAAGGYGVLVFSRRRIEAAVEMAMKAVVLEGKTRKRTKRRSRLARAKRRNLRPIVDTARPPGPPARPSQPFGWPVPRPTTEESPDGQ